jgi:DNA-binding LytR/AlgR family response regulator
MVVLEDRILLHLQDGRRIPVDPQDIYFPEAEGGETLLRTRHAQPLTDVRQLSELIDVFEPIGFAQIHRSWAVNLRRVREIRVVVSGDRHIAGIPGVDAENWASG